VLDYSVALAESRQNAESADILRRYLQRNPADRDAYNQLGKIYLLNDQGDAASQAFSRAIPVSTLNNYATSLKKLGKMEDAEATFKLALRLNPNDSEVLFNLGNLYNATNKLEQARNNYLQAIQLRPDFAEAHYNLGLIYSKLGDKTQAVTHLEKFLKLSPEARNAETIRAYVQKLKA
jgi:tetratricopeptide (TPR) repeat protein